MTRQTLITAAMVAALASPLAAADQSVEKAKRYRAGSPAAAVPASDVARDAVKPAPMEFDTSVAFDELGAFVANENTAQIDELGGRCCYYWNDSADQVEELGPYYWNENADQVEELGCCYQWNQNTEQVEELGGKDRFHWNQNTEQVEELGPFMLNQTEQVEELGPKKKMAIKYN